MVLLRRLKYKCSYLIAIALLILLFCIVLLYHSFNLQSDKITLNKYNFDLKRNSTEFYLVDRKIRIIIENNPCSTSTADKSNGKEILLLILITSHAGDREFRQRIRKIFPLEEMDRLGMKRVFLLAIPPTFKHVKYASSSLKLLLQESQDFSDIIVGDFYESYRNLTYKHLMGLKWSIEKCPNAQFILKQDDDIIIDYYQLPEFLTKEKHRLLQNGILGKVLSNQTIIRDPNSKWFVTSKEINPNLKFYPEFVSGWGYFTSISAIKKILKYAEKVEKDQSKYFYIDDSYITGILREKSTSIKLYDLSKYFTVFKGQMICCISPYFSVSKANDPLWCDFLIGPSNDDFNLVENFLQHSQFCYTSKLCKKRKLNETLDKTCIITEADTIQSSQLRIKGTALLI